MKDLYETDQYEVLNPSWHEEDSPWKAHHVETILRRNGIVPDTIAEIGCGTGEILLNLEAAFPAATLSGWEIAPQAYQRAVPKQTTRTSFHLADLLVEPGQHFDVVLAADVIEHVEDYFGFLAKLKPLATYKVLHIPLDLSVQALLRSTPIMHARQAVGHIHYFYQRTALAALRDSGYEVLDHFYTAGRLELSNQTVASTLMKLPRRVLYKINPDLGVRLLGGYSLMVLAR